MGFKLLPPVVKNILIINFLFFLATISLGSAFHWNLKDLLGLHFFTASQFRPYQIITYMFMHDGFTHVFFNMFALWMFGYALENYWGAKRFLIYFLVTGVGAALIHYTVMYYFELAPALRIFNNFLDNPNIGTFHEFIVSNNLRESFIEFCRTKNVFSITDSEQELQLAVDFMVNYKQAFLNAPVVVGASGAVFGILLAFGMLFPNTLIYLYFFIPINIYYLS